MNQGFQKNPFMKSSTPQSSSINNSFSCYDKLGRKTVEEVRQGMENLKYNQSQPKKQELPNHDFNHTPDFKKRVDNLRNINRG